MAGKLGPGRIKNKNYGSQDILTAIIFKNTAAEPPSEAAVRLKQLTDWQRT